MADRSQYRFLEPDDLETIESDFAELFAYWCKIKGNQPIPHRDKFDPMALPNLLPKMFMVDSIDDGTSFRYSLVGTDIVEFLGFDPTDRVINQPLSSTDTYERVCLVYKNQKPLLATGIKFSSQDAAYDSYSVIHFPFFDGQKINKILSLSNVTPEKKLFVSA